MIARIRALAREPVAHFALIGATLFALDAALAHPDAAPPDAERCPIAVPRGPIIVDDEARARLIADWTRTHPEPPTADELARLVQGLVDQEVLYREGLSRGLAEHDPQVHARVASQMTYVLESQLTIPEPDDAELHAWFRDHPTRYGRPERVDLTQVFVSSTDANAEARARELLRLLQSGADPNGLGDTFPGGRRLRGRKPADLAARFGEAFAAGLEAQPPGTWTLRPSPLGLHLVRVDRWTSGEAASFDAVRDRVRHDWQQDQRDRAMERAKQALRERWEIVHTP